MSVIYDKISTRDAFGVALAEAADKYENLFAIGADTTKSMGYKPMMAKYPDRVINNGIDLSVFKPTESDFREKHGINQGGTDTGDSL